MFWRAGFNKRHKVICYAVISRHGRIWSRPARLVRFVPSGELAWVGGGGISWPEHVDIVSARAVGPRPVPPAVEMGYCVIAYRAIYEKAAA